MIVITPQIVIPSYIFIISLVYCFSIYWVVRRSQKLNLATTTALDICLIIMIFGFLGGRAFHIFYEAWDYYATRPLDMLKVWQGGFVFYGGFLSALITTFIYIKYQKLNFGKWADLFAPIAAVGYAVGRFGCFLNGCCYGKLCDLPWAVQFTLPGQIEGHRHPTQLYSTFWDLGIFLLLVLIEKKPRWLKSKISFIYKHSGSLFFFWLFCHCLGRLWIEQLRDDLRGDQFYNYSISSWLSFGFIVLSLAFFIYSHRVNRKKYTKT